MEGQHPSFIKNLRARFSQSRSISQPPVDRNIEWDAVPVEYRPIGHRETRIISSQERHTLQPYVPAAYHLNPLPREIKRASTPSAPLLQLPRPRATWRRSLEDLSPTKKNEWWTDPDIEAQRMTFNIACALPPQYLEDPPAYSDCCEENISDGKDPKAFRDPSPFRNLYTGERIPFFYDGTELTPTPGTTDSRESRSRRRGSTGLQSTKSSESTFSYQSSSNITIDGLLSHPMLRVQGPEQTERRSWFTEGLTS